MKRIDLFGNFPRPFHEYCNLDSVSHDLILPKSLAREICERFAINPRETSDDEVSERLDEIVSQALRFYIDSLAGVEKT
jgi:hypothetical protein